MLLELVINKHLMIFDPDLPLGKVFEGVHHQGKLPFDPPFPDFFEERVLFPFIPDDLVQTLLVQ